MRECCRSASKWAIEDTGWRGCRTSLPDMPPIDVRPRGRRGLGQSVAMDEGTLAAIGSTPLIRLGRLVPDGAAAVWVKMEAANPTGSYEARMALAMIRGPSALADSARGRRWWSTRAGAPGARWRSCAPSAGTALHIVTSDAFAVEKRRTMEAFGASVEVVASPAGITPELIPRMRARAAELAGEVGGFQTDQFRNTDMIDGYRRLGEEIIGQLADSVDALCLYVGTAGCFLGVTRAMRGSPPAAVPGGGRTGGIGRPVRWCAGYAPHRGWRRRVPARSARPLGRRRGRHRVDGRRFRDWPAGRHASKGCCPARPPAPTLRRALLAGRLGPGRTVVTIQVDSGLKYLAGDLYDAT